MRTPFLAIGPLQLSTPVLLAPMAGYADLAFRLSVRPLGGIALAYTEMLNPLSLLHGRGRKRAALLATSAADRPLAYQLYGAEVEPLAQAARWIEERGGALIDLNMGCPQRKIATRGAGAGLLLDPPKAAALARRVVETVRIPVTVKLRLGWDRARLVAPELAAALEDAGVAAITIHGRTRGQGFTGRADLTAMRQVVEAVRRIPVIGNGDVVSPAAARAMLAETGCAAIMIGRGMLTNPWLIRDVARDLLGEPPLPPPTRAEQIAFLRTHVEHMLDLYGPRYGPMLFRKWIPQYVRKLLPNREEMVRWLRFTEAEELRGAVAALGT